MSLARYLSKLGALLNSSGQVQTAAIADSAVTAAKLASGAARSNFGAGAVLQVVTASYSSPVSSSSSTPIDLGVSATITPSSTSSKILVLMSCDELRTRGANGGISMWLYRNGSSIQKISQELGYNQSFFPATFSSQFVDSPATTSATTYKLYGANGINTVAVEWNPNGNGVQIRITLLEIAG